MPLQWATTQNNLGIALEGLGERESGTARLQEAVKAYHGALEELTRDRVPLDWAQTRNNLGIALERLGDRESETAHLDEAIAAWEACLVVTGSISPQSWVEGVHSRIDRARVTKEQRLMK